ncbi:MFS transporter [Streptantibioticus cattleyicolor]|uniref:Transmembrane efflux protein n=1 Tax=Streptantibioticus cattleyicolor (strain ATCC 35852 / DSM 46488 / JCM 4925 / NBRC 14057 / NRRL 8057) TaxID=1003195 RepID=F8JLC2_STREN|nr:MFS transporter [Streptantibioticus cattleyicolor]AEW99591.1 transmembrane efflux protein [Streptantibioticus cattleyicolor NRRL 8057 = DSM 46488]CCB71371.1 Arabinose efflux permease family protein [Streptantibioticus cattleyicolor NRRL 8057 = DSM 46488]
MTAEASTPAHDTAGRAGPRARSAPVVPGVLALVTLCASHFMDAIDLSDVGVALPAIQHGLGMSPASLQWVVSAYALGYGGFLLLGGRAADLLGRRRTFLTAVAVFAVVGVLGAVAPGGAALIGARLVKGVAAGFLAPAALSLITTNWPEGRERGRALGWYATAGAGGFVGGLVLGGALTEVSWRLVFALPVPIAVAAFAAGGRLLPPDPPRAARRRIDVAGALTVTGGLLVCVYAIAQAPDHGWTSVRTIALFTVAVLLLAAFLRLEARRADALVPLSFLTRRRSAGTNLTIFAMWGAYTSFAFLATLYLQNVLGWSPLATSGAFVPLGLVNGAVAPFAGRLAARFGTQRVIATGMLLLAASYAMFLRIGPEASFVSVVLPVMVLNGLGTAATFPALNMSAVSGVADRDQGLAGALLNTSMQIGGAVVLAVVTAVTEAGRRAGGGADPSAGYLPATAVVIGVVLAGLAATTLLRDTREPTTTAPRGNTRQGEAS